MPTRQRLSKRGNPRPRVPVQRLRKHERQHEHGIEDALTSPATPSVEGERGSVGRRSRPMTDDYVRDEQQHQRAARK
jgi:hypothetical protein